jgi:hypothetical protein
MRFPWYPVVFGVYPVLMLLSNNKSELPYYAGFRAMLVSALLAGAILFLLGRLWRDFHRAAFAILIFQLFFFTYGHLFNFLQGEWKLANVALWFPFVWLAIGILAFVWLGVKKVGPVKVAGGFSLIALGLLIMPGYQVVQNANWYDTRTAGARNAPIQALSVPDEQAAPDIYYIIVDSYARNDLLMQAYGYDNTSFVDYLKEKGFYVAECSQSNYRRTELSLGSSLNMEYLQDLDPAFAPDSRARRPLWKALRYSAVRQSLEEAGYKTVAFQTGFAWTELSDADHFLGPSQAFGGMNEFEVLLLQTTVLRPLDDAHILHLDRLAGQHYRDRTLYVFDHFDDLARMPGPKFVFIHIAEPHPPVVFGPDGEVVDPADYWNDHRLYTSSLYAKGYVGQVQYLNKRLETAISTLLDESPTPPVIIIQGDHGPWLQAGENMFKVLNAYYLPGHSGDLYPTISPVNSFRVVLNAYLGGHYELLPDLSYYSPVPLIYKFNLIPNRCKGQ